jgi:outer membrane protein TolC
MNERRSCPPAIRLGILLGLGLGFGAFPLVAQTAGAPQPLTLRHAAERALARAPEIAVARAELEEGAATVRGAESALGPQAIAHTTPGYTTGLPVLVAGQVPAVVGLEVRQTLYDPSRHAEVREGQARALALEGALERTSAATLRALIVSYARNWAAVGSVESARRRLESREAIERRVTALAREGRRTDLEVDVEGLETARARQRLLDQLASADLARLELTRLIDWPAGSPLVLADDPVGALPDAFPGDTLEKARAADPELHSLDRQLENLRAAAALQQKSWLPTVEAEAQYLRLAKYNNFDQYFNNFKENDFTIGVSVVLPLWTGNRLSHATSATRARLDRAEAARRARERDLELEVRRAESDVAVAGAHLALARRGAAVAAEALRVARALAAEGRAEPDDVDRREIALADAQDDLASATQGVVAARVKLVELRGEMNSAIFGAKS